MGEFWPLYFKKTSFNLNLSGQGARWVHSLWKESRSSRGWPPAKKILTDWTGKYKTWSRKLIYCCAGSIVKSRATSKLRENLSVYSPFPGRVVSQLMALTGGARRETVAPGTCHKSKVPHGWPSSIGDNLAQQICISASLVRDKRSIGGSLFIIARIGTKSMPLASSLFNQRAREYNDKLSLLKERMLTQSVFMFYFSNWKGTGGFSWLQEERRGGAGGSGW